jgi:hypothetical protein
MSICRNPWPDNIAELPEEQNEMIRDRLGSELLNGHERTREDASAYFLSYGQPMSLCKIIPGNMWSDNP